MKEGQFEVVTQEIARVNLNILGISELKWTGMSKFNSDDHFTYYWGQESLRKKCSSPHSQQKSPKSSTWVQSQKQQNDFCLLPRQTIHYHSNPMPWPVMLKKLIHYRGLECKSRKSRDTWSNRQSWPWSTEWAGKSNRVLKDYALVTENTFQQHKGQFYTWTSSDRWSIPKSDWL